MAAIPCQKADPCIRAEWSDKPGLWDPFAVAQVCIPILSREVYPCMESLRAQRANILTQKETKPTKEDLCRGITMYLTEWNIEEGIDKAVQRYIYYPCQMEMTRCIDGKPERALAFILAYLKYRGPFFIWTLRNGSDALGAGRCVSTSAQQFLNQLPDLDFSAAIHIGRHLSYLLSVACGHNIHYMKSVISKVWGPLYVGVDYERSSYPDKRLTDTGKVKLATEIFSRLVETVTWNSMCPFQGVKRNIQQDKLSRLIRYENVNQQYVQNHLREPNFNGSNLSDMMQNAAMCRAEKIDEARRKNPCKTAWETSSSFEKPSEVCADVKGFCLDEKRNREKFYPIPKPDVPFPPDKCQLVYGRDC